MLPSAGRISFGECKPAISPWDLTLACLLSSGIGRIIAKVQQLQQERDELRAANELAEGRATPAAEKVAALEGRLAAMQGAVPALSIHKAWFRAALAGMERIAEVDAAVRASGEVAWELWANATTISRDDADVVAIAAEPSIDLDAVFAAARAFQAARGG
jgi:hypothetical protein